MLPPDGKLFRALTRQITEFFAFQLSGLSDIQRAIFRYDDHGREIISARFEACGENWKVQIESPSERPPLGRVSLSGPGDEFTGPIDAVTWDRIGEIIKTNGEH